MNYSIKTFLSMFMLSLVGNAYAQEEKIEWMSISEMEEAMKEEPRNVFVDIYTDWCGWCKKMDKTTFSDPEVVAFVNKNYYAVKLDAEGKDSISFLGHNFKYQKSGRRGYHELAAALTNGQLSYPTITYIDDQMNPIEAVPGFVNAQEFIIILNYFHDDAHKVQEFEQYKKNYRSN